MIKITSSEAGLSSISFVDSHRSPLLEPGPCWHQEAMEQIRQYFQGSLKKFTFKLDLRGSGFQKKVWRELLNIPWGTTLSYKDLAQNLGDPQAIRAVGLANSKNPLAIAVPCHRVIGSNGNLVGYAGGLFRKKWLLKHEGALKQLELF